MQVYLNPPYTANERYHARMDSVGWVTIIDIPSNSKITAPNKAYLKDLIKVLEELYEKIP